MEENMKKEMASFVSAMDKLLYAGRVCTLEKSSVESRHIIFQKRMKKQCRIAALLAGILVLFAVSGAVYACVEVQRAVTVTKKGFSVDDRQEVGEGQAEENIYHNYSAEAAAVSEAGRTETADKVSVTEYHTWEDAEKDISFPVVIPNVNFGEKTLLKITYQNMTGQNGTQAVEAAYTATKKYVNYQIVSYAGTSGWSVSHEYNGENANSRTYINAYGYEFSMIDNRNPLDEQLRTYVTIAFPWYEMQLEFKGLEETEIEEVLDSLDLAVYEY